MVYLLIGEDEVSKQGKIKAIKQQLLSPQLESFNCETLYAKALNLVDLKEAFARLPVSCANRLLVIRDIHKLKEDLKAFLIEQVKDLPKYLTVVLDMPVVTRDDNFILGVSRSCRILNFTAEAKKDVFSLARAIEARHSDWALDILADLVRAGEKPEKILGGLRYHFAKGLGPAGDRMNKIGLLLEADVRIKTGRLRPEFALEALVVKLCN